MSIKIDLKIFLFGILFFLTKQIKLYAILMVFALLHELGHLCSGLVLGFKPKSISINPMGFQITFYTKIEDCNKKIKKENKLCLKRAIIAMAGPLTNIFIVLICLLINSELVISKDIIIYSNLLLAFFNLIPIYPLDGGRIFKEIIHIFKGEEKSYKIINLISKVIVILLTILDSFLILYIHNIALILILIYLWCLVLKSC